ncbi:hypothetical protein B0H16DRAFT_1262246, partial [Mycena metata]
TVQLLSTLASAALLGFTTSAHQGGNCDTSQAVLDLLTTQTPPAAPLFWMLGVGLQNYSCSSTPRLTRTKPSLGIPFDLTYLF